MSEQSDRLGEATKLCTNGHRFVCDIKIPIKG